MDQIVSSYLEVAAKLFAGQRVVALAAEAFGGYGGIAQSTRDMMLVLSTLNQVEAIDILPRLAAAGSAGTQGEGIQQHAPRPSRLAYTLELARLVASVRPHVIYCGHLYMVPLAALLAGVFGAKLVVHLHGVELWRPLSWWHRIGLERADLALCVSNDTRRRLLAATRLQQETASVIFNTYSQFFAPGDRAAARLQFGLTNEVVLLTVSRLDARQRHKGHEAVISSLPSLLADGHDVVYLIAGDGDDRQRLEDLAIAHEVAANTRFLGRVPTESLPDLYRAADLYVMPSTGEGFGIAFIEAMACGTPALGLAIGGAVDSLCNGELGIAVSMEEFSRALKECIEQPKQDPSELAAAVEFKFGAPAFRQRVQSAWGELFA